MGVRDRIKNRLKKRLLGEREQPSASPKAQTAAPPTPPAQTPPKPAPKETPVLPATVAPKMPTEPKTPAAPKTPAEPKEPAKTVQKAAPAKKAKVSRSHNDAPSRNAHLRPSFSTSSAAFTVRVEDADIGLNESFPCEPDEFVLEAAERAGIELPFSCRSGGCLSCAGQLIEGETDMTEQFVLEESHIAEGFRLLCCTTVQSDASFIANQEGAID